MTSQEAEQPRPLQWTKRQALAAVAVAVVIGGLGGGAVYAATQGSPHAMAGGMRPPIQHAPAGVAPPPAQVPDQPGAGVLHSEYVVADGHGGFATRMTQTGVVDELTLSQIVIRSDDGFTQIYEFPSASVVPGNSVAAKDTVTVEATRTGSTVTLNRIGESRPPAGN